MDYRVQAYKYRNLANKYPPGSVEYQRCIAIAESFKKGETNYGFTTGPLPMGK